MSDRPLDEKAIFRVACSIDSTEARKEYLQQVCGSDSGLYNRLATLVRMQAEEPEFLESPAAGVTATIQQPISEQPGAVIGPYKLLQVIGEGGMGVVYMAEQSEPVTRRVALKIIKQGMDTGQVIARFEAERQSLAMMDHPNIAKILDAGATDTGRPYFVMELVKGIPISEYCDEQHFTPKQRLELFIKVCHAVQHAHQKGIIHRDLKPSNVLVAEYDHQAVPKIIDFGVAKATSQKLTEKTMFTQYGQIIGTLEYMSPEQAKLNQLDIDTRSDVYSLGVLLYQLLTGTTPFERERLQSAAFEEMLRIIREEEPPKPSTRLSTIGKSAVKTSSYRRTNPHKLQSFVRGELDWIVMRSLEKERSRRYESASLFAADIERFLCGDAVQACPPSRVYQFRKFVRRNRAAMATAAIVAVAVLLGLIGTGSQAYRATLAARRAQRESLRANEQLRIGTVVRLTAQAESIRDERPVESLLLAIEAVGISRQEDGTRAIAHQTLLNASLNVGGRPLPGSSAYALAISPNSRWLVTGNENVGEGGLALVWDLAHEDPASSLIVLRGHEDRIRTMAITIDSRWLVTGDIGGAVRMWDLNASNPPSTSRQLPGHGPGVVAIATSPDGRWLATGGADAKTRLWDLTAEDPAQSHHVLEGHSEEVRTVAFSPDSRLLATSGNDDTVFLWDVADEDPALSSRVLRGHSDNVLLAAFIPNGRWLVTAGSDMTARLWDLSDFSSRVLSGHTHGVIALAISPDSHWLVTGSADKTVRLWDLASEDVAASPTVLRRHGGFIMDIAISPDSRWVVTGSRDRVPLAWDLHSQDPGASPIELRGHEDVITRLAMTPDGRWLATCGWDSIVRLWVMADDGPVASTHVLQGHRGRIFALDISDDGRWLASGSRDGTLRIWDLLNDSPANSRTVLAGQASPIRQVTFFKDSRRVLSRSEPGTSRIWSLAADGTPVSAHILVGDPVALGPDNRLLVLVNDDGRATVHDLTTDGPSAPRFNLEMPAPMTAKYAFSPGGQLLVAGCEDGTIRMWNVSADNVATPSHVLNGHRKAVLNIAFSPNGRWLVSGGSDFDVRLWDLAARDIGSSCRVLRGHVQPVRALAVGPGSRWLVTGAAEGVARLWDLKADRPEDSAIRLLGHSAYMTSVEISGDGRFAVTGSGDTTSRVWDLTADDPSSSPMILRGHDDHVRSVAIGPNGRWVATGGDDAVVRLWDMNIEACIDRVSTFAGRQLTAAQKKAYLSPEL